MGGQSWAGGLTGGAGYVSRLNMLVEVNISGGFGGGGGAYTTNWALPGGGGGYTGGNAPAFLGYSPYCSSGGGGGGSWWRTSAPVNTGSYGGVNYGGGYVTVTPPPYAWVLAVSNGQSCSQACAAFGGSSCYGSGAGLTSLLEYT